MKKVNREHLARKFVTIVAVMSVGFLCGWSAAGLTSGVVLSLALAAGTAVPIFSDERTDCVLPSLRRRNSTRPK